MSRRPGARGFTLVEVLVAVSLLASLGIFLQGAFAAMIRTQQVTDHLQERHHTARVAMVRMAREISILFESRLTMKVYTLSFSIASADFSVTTGA